MISKRRDLLLGFCGMAPTAALGASPATHSKAHGNRGAIDVKRDFGALGDGVTDDSGAFDAFFQAIAGQSGYVPPATDHYKITKELTVRAHTTVYGDGYSSQIRQYAREQNVLIAGGDFITIDGLHLRGDNGTTGVAFEKNNGIYASAIKGLKVRGCYIERCEAAGIQCRDVTDYEISGNIFFLNPQGAFSSAADVLMYSSHAGARGIITTNHCLSNNSQGIYYSALGRDSDTTISNNICVTLNSSWTELAPGSMHRRHGIITSYNGGGQSRLSVTGNICRNTSWTGIYCQSNSMPTGPVTITGNICSKNGYASRNSLSGGIFVSMHHGSAVIANNAIIDFQGDTTGGITLSWAHPDGHVLVTGNSVVGSRTFGLYGENHIRHARIENNYFWGNANTDICFAATASLPNIGDVSIVNNTIVRNSGATVPCMFVDSQSGRNRWIIEGNKLRGFDNTTKDISNVGIQVRRPTVTAIRDNFIENFYYGVNAGTVASSTRFFDTILIDYNHFKDLNTGILLGSGTPASVVPVEGNIFTNVTHKLGSDSPSKVAYIARRDGDRIVVLDLNEAPVSGTWRVGDRVDYVIPVSGGYIGAVYTTKGWRNYGLVN